MEFSRSIILDFLKRYRGINCSAADPRRTYRWVSLLPEQASLMEKNILYVCNLTDALKRVEEISGYHYVCVCNCFWDEEENVCPEEIIIIKENWDVSFLLNLIQKRLIYLSDWIESLQQALLNQCDYQTLIDLSEPVLDNFVSVLDSSYKLLAYTKNVTSSDPINVSLLEKGYHTEETIRLFQKNKRFKYYDETPGLIITQPGEISRFETVSKWCRYKSEPVLHVVMVCSKTPLSPGLTELFDLFMYYFEICFRNEQSKSPVFNPIYAPFLLDVIYGKLDNPHIVAERAKTVDVPYYGSFNVYRITFEDNAIVLMGRVAGELSDALLNSKIVAKNYELTILNIYSDEASIEALSEQQINRIRPILEKYAAYCGVSAAFSSLRDLKTATIQATRAQRIGLKLWDSGDYWNVNHFFSETQKSRYDNMVYLYDKYFPYYMIHVAKENSVDVFHNTQYGLMLDKLKEIDRENNSNLVQILYCHLICERRATNTGKLMHMHRNNVLYHIARIEEMLSINLDDYMTRYSLITAFLLAELQEANRSELEK